mmetsp:Transcript_12033/g.33128  ORF Transcript_12033/g.33128 Transcript_12033/m.33128 type:complete len:527 (-) Transcript_12033:1236-2816(-)
MTQQSQRVILVVPTHVLESVLKGSSEDSRWCGLRRSDVLVVGREAADSAEAITISQIKVIRSSPTRSNQQANRTSAHHHHHQQQHLKHHVSLGVVYAHDNRQVHKQSQSQHHRCIAKCVLLYDGHANEGILPNSHSLIRANTTLSRILQCIQDDEQAGKSVASCIPLRATTAVHAGKVQDDIEQGLWSRCWNASYLLQHLQSLLSDDSNIISIFRMPLATMASSSSSCFLIDTMLDIIFGLCIIQCQFDIVLPQALLHSFTTHLTWLEHNPMGFKLNSTLTRSMGRMVRLALRMRDWVLGHLRESDVISVRSPYAGVVWKTMCIPFGASTMLSLHMDILQMHCLHITLLFRIFRAVFRLENYMMTSLLRLFRGKKYNILRRRTDSMKYDSIQVLLLGTICFCVCIFSWTTAFVYFAYFSFYRTVAQCTWILPWLLLRSIIGGERTSKSIGCQQRPSSIVSALYERSQHPGRFVESVYMEQRMLGQLSVHQIKVKHVSYGTIVGRSIGATVRVATTFCSDTFRGLMR